MIENAKGECRDEDEKEAVYQRGEGRVVEKGQSENQAGEETCQRAKKDAREFHAPIIKVTVTLEVTVT